MAFSRPNSAGRAGDRNRFLREPGRAARASLSTQADLLFPPSLGRGAAAAAPSDAPVCAASPDLLRRRADMDGAAAPARAPGRAVRGHSRHSLPARRGLGQLAGGGGTRAAEPVVGGGQGRTANLLVLHADGVRGQPPSSDDGDGLRLHGRAHGVRLRAVQSRYVGARADRWRRLSVHRRPQSLQGKAKPPSGDLSVPKRGRSGTFRASAREAARSARPAPDPAPAARLVRRH
jgi:hypothetical protein